MKLEKQTIARRWLSVTRRWIVGGIAAAVVGLAAVTWAFWWPSAERWVQHAIAATRDAPPATGHGHAHDDPHEDGGHEHEHAGHDHVAHAHGEHAHAHSEATSLHLSPQAQRNLGLNSQTVRPVALETYRRAITVPAIVVERPGRTRIQVATPLTGVVTHVHAVKGETVEPGTLLFQIRLTHEDLVRTQTEFLKTLGELDVERKELERLESLTGTGAVAGRLALEREYAVEKLEALLTAQREALRLHGLSDRQVEQVAEERRLLRELQIVAPSPDEHEHGDELRLTGRDLQPVAISHAPPEAHAHQSKSSEPLVIQELAVHKGQAVAAGENLCVVADFRELFIEGNAFERDADAIAHALHEGWTVTAVFERTEGAHVLEGLEFAYLANEVDVHSRTLSFYVRLPNEIVRDTVNAQGQRFVGWRYRPGQRLQLRVPVEEWEDQIVLPVEAVARQGAEWFVFQQNGDHFDRVSVHVKYRDQTSVVIANDGSLFPGDVVARRSAHQMQMALENKAGGGVDPHAGHSH
jgi:multidrug efflux pump subunit AcrA (membrane-fusion protein)